MEINPPLFRSEIKSWHGHQKFAIHLMGALKPRVMVELGVHNGDSFFSFCQGTEVFKLSTKLYGIDTWKGDPIAGFYGEEVFSKFMKEVLTNWQSHNETDPLVVIYRNSFDESLKNFELSEIDLLHIDGRHDYQSVSHDFNLWLPKVSNTGIILLHDIHADKFGHSSIHNEVPRFWKEIKKNFVTDEFTHSWGLGIIYMNPKSHIKQFVSQWKELQITD